MADLNRLKVTMECHIAPTSHFIWRSWHIMPSNERQIAPIERQIAPMWHIIWHESHFIAQMK